MNKNFRSVMVFSLFLASVSYPFCSFAEMTMEELMKRIAIASQLKKSDNSAVSAKIAADKAAADKAAAENANQEIPVYEQLIDESEELKLETSNDKKTEEPVVKKPSRKEMVYYTNLGRASDVLLLIKRGGSPDEVNDDGDPIISLASARADNDGLSVVKALVKAGADIDKLDSRGQNALFYAAKVGNKHIADYLLSKKIDNTVVDKSGNTARDIAFKTGHNDIITTLDRFVIWKNNKEHKEQKEKIAEFEKKMEEYKALLHEKEMAIRATTAENPSRSRVQEAVYNASFASCAATYWEFCKSVKQPTQFTAQDLDSNIDAQSNRVKEHSSRLSFSYVVAYDTVKNIVDVSSEKIKSQLSSFPSNELRRENGIGTVNDMNDRCNEIAQTWDASVKRREPRRGGM
jgi:ankyrin repeat protein